jgi:hypothetical protein
VSQDPSAVYHNRLAAQQSAHARLERLNANFAYARLGVLALVITTAFISWRAAVRPWSLIPLGAAFLVLIVRHDRTIRARDVVARAISYYERALARIGDRWIGTGEPGTRFLDERHPYAVDLDIFGPGSIFELLSTVRTRAGEEQLARWLLSGADPDTIRARQQAVAELGPAVTLREQMAATGPGLADVVDSRRLSDWAGQKPLGRLPFLRLTTYVSATASIAATAWLAVTGNLLPMEVVIVLQFAAGRAFGKDVERVLHIASDKARDLHTLGRLFLHVESAAVSASRLATLRGMLVTPPVSASHAVRSLQRLSQRHDWGHSLPLIPVGLFVYGVYGAEWALNLALVVASALLLFSPVLALGVERWRRVYGGRVGTWLAALAEFEATLALATYHFEHPQDPFPTIEADGPRPNPVFDGKGLGHPLLPSRAMVRNDVRLTASLQLLIVSGSNMSGKSTLLRTVGVNAVLAFAGAPVRATSLRISPLSIGATLRIQDSLQDGRSRFFAEITRIRGLVDLAAGPVPLLFLLDEVLHGTNSHDRLVGASGILRGLLARGAIGLVTTHDLALTAIADQIGPQAANIHFEDFFEGSEMQFDYRIKAGAVRRSNALALMRAVGLELEPEVET